MNKHKTHMDLSVPIDGEDTFLEVPIPDYELGASLQLNRNNPNHEPLEGLDVPKEVSLWRMSEIDRERWLVVVEELMGKGIESTEDIRRITRLGNHVIRKFRQEVHDRWSASLTVGQINIRRERLYGQAQLVLDECIKGMKNAENPRTKVAFIKMALEAQKRQSALIGAEKIKVEVEQKVTGKHLKEDDYDLIAQENNLEIEDLRLIGKLLSEKGMGNE